MKKVLLGVVFVLFWGGIGYYTWIVEPRQSQSTYEKKRAAAKQRYYDWAYVAKEKELAPGETLRMVVIPNSLGEFFDTRCLIYTHREFKTSSMICPDADQSDLAESDQ